MSICGNLLPARNASLAGRCLTCRVLGGAYLWRDRGGGGGGGGGGFPLERGGGAVVRVGVEVNRFSSRGV
jgi:hypothetical protein